MTENEESVIKAIQEMTHDAPTVGLCALPFRELEKQVRQIIAEKDFAVSCINNAVMSGDLQNICQLCANHIPCLEKKCDKYTSGKGLVDAITGKEYPELKWECMDADFGTCPKMVNTPCNGCDYKTRFKFKGLGAEIPSSEKRE